MESANNDQSCLKNLREEIKLKGEQLSKIQEMSSELKVQQISHDTKLIENLSEQFEKMRSRLYGMSKDSLPRNKLSNEPGTELVRKVNRVREGIAVTARHLHSPPLSGADFQNFPQQEQALQQINDTIAELKQRVDKIEKSREGWMKVSTPEMASQLRRVIDKLREEWSQLNRNFGDRHGKWIRCNETWRSLNSDCNAMNEWMTAAEELLRSPSKQRHVDLEKQATMKHRTMNSIFSRFYEVSLGSSKNGMSGLERNVNSLRTRWKALLASLQFAKERRVLDSQTYL